MKGVAILGSTGSIGRSALEVIRSNPGRFRVVALAAGDNTELLKEQAEEFKPDFVSVSGKEAAARLGKILKAPVGAGVEGAEEAARCKGADVVISAISGAAGLLPTLAAIRAGKAIALANKETLVLAGALVMEEARRHGARIIPVDSEHSAVFQSLAGHRKEDLKRVVLTASGGPFLNKPVQELDNVTPAEALKHPRWSMGRKISIDSATLMNKGLEVIEASHLFGLPGARISVVIHPQSVVHSMAEYVDGSIISQMSVPDMKGPIAYALSLPERIGGVTKPLELSGLRLDFMEPDLKMFPCLALAYSALQAGGTAPAALNAADEEAVAMFLNGRIPFTGIYRVISEVMGAFSPKPIKTIEDVLEADRIARLAAASVKALS
ncbi:MAG: 1-deoxy-D-xylulose-5-phosphate reductoisomerase [Deltaproteobacteria bacterium]|nr:1-deoxy-D-xylulose-5-phosphate reductoisomerase [Deltaproteobacteria bacterium]